MAKKTLKINIERFDFIRIKFLYSFINLAVPVALSNSYLTK